MATKTRNEQPGRPGRRPSLNADHTAVLRTIIREQPRSSLGEVTRELLRRAGVKVSTVTVRKALREAGIERLKPLRRAGERAAAQGAAPVRYGYTAAHRRRDGASGMNTDLTDAEWALVADLFERDGQRGAPARYERRHMVNACCYALRTGCAWRLLPKTFPPWQATYKSFSRWAAAGEKGREMDYQVWTGPAMGAFNQWVKGTYLEAPQNRRVVDVTRQILTGCAVMQRVRALEAQGVVFPAALKRYVPEQS